MFIAEFLICFSSALCTVYREEMPVGFNSEEVCLDHAQALLPQLTDGSGYKYAIIHCVRLKGERI